MGAAAAFVGVSTLAIGGSATAADFYVLDSDFVAETSPYPAGWFVGGGSTGTKDSTVSGLELVGPYQILNGTTPTTGLVDLVAGAEFGVVSGEAAFPIPLFADGVGNTGYTTLVPEVPGDLGLHSTAPGSWRTTQAIAADSTNGNGTAYAAGTWATLPEFEAALGTDLEILAFGAYLPLTKSAVVSHITWAGNTHWFLPAPTATITPVSLTVDQMGKTGVSGVFTGFVPGEAVTAGFADGGSGGPLPGSYTADANGSVTVTHSAASLTPGTYTLSTFAEGSGVSVFGSFAVVANPAVVVADPAVLAATGAEVTPFVIAGSLLLLTGAGLGAVAIRRRATTVSS